MTASARVKTTAARQAPKPYFIPAGSGSRHLIFPGVEIRTTAGTNLMLSVVRFEPESVVLDHSHPHEQMGILLEGPARVHRGGRHSSARPRRHLAHPRRGRPPRPGPGPARRGARRVPPHS